MWISTQISKPREQDFVQSGKVTLNNGGSVEAVSTGVERNLNTYSPYGYSFSMPQGCEVLLTQSDGQKTALGVLMKNENLQCGEIKITAASGAYIHLKSDGSVVINGMTISSSGVIE